MVGAIKFHSDCFNSTSGNSRPHQKCLIAGENWILRWCILIVMVMVMAMAMAMAMVRVSVIYMRVSLYVQGWEWCS